MRLSEEEINKKLAELPGWTVSEGVLQRTYTLASFAHALLWMNAVGQLAEAAGHHPDLRLFGYKNVTIQLVTHSADGLTEKDFNLAAQIADLPQKKAVA